MPSAIDPPLLRNSNFRWLLGGGLVSMLGDQFSMLALPWLVLSLTGDSLSLGIAVALMGAPRAVLILLGGTVADRYSPRRVLLLSKYANAVILLALAGLLMLDHTSLALAYAAALALGIASAFGIPAGTAILPQAVPPQNSSPTLRWRSSAPVAAADSGASPRKMPMNTAIARPSMAGATRRCIHVKMATCT